MQLPRSENFWQAGPVGPCGPCSEIYYDRGPEYGPDSDRPGDDTERHLEYWNLVFMTYELREDGGLTDLPQLSIDTGLGVERLAAIKQDVPSVYETDLFAPLVELAEELSGRSFGADERTTRAMRIIADHSRGTVNLIADGVVPSNEDRGYILRRIMRRAIQQGRVLELEPPYLGRFAERAIETLADAYPHLAAERDAIMRWVADEERSFGHTLERGTELLDALVAEARQQGTSWVDAAEAFKLHDTYGFPYDLTKELLAEQGLSVDDGGFEELMDRQRERARSGAESVTADRHGAVISFVDSAPESRFVGYETLAATTSVAASAPADGDGDGDASQVLVKLEESPFYPEGGGQVADSGVVRWEGGEASVLDVYRVGDDQALKLEARRATGAWPARSKLASSARRATRRCETTPRPTCCTPPCASGSATHVRQAGSAVRPDKLRFDFTHGAALSPEELREVEDRVNDWIKASLPVRAMKMGRDEAERLGAMALFGEKYGDWVRVVEVEDVSRELCGGTHVANTAEVGIFTIVSEGSSAANVRRVEALTGPAAIDHFRERSDALREAGAAARLAARSGERGAAAPPSVSPSSNARRRRSGSEARRAGGERARRAQRRHRRDQGSSPRAPRPPTSTRCSTSPTASRRASATPRSCSAAPHDGASRSSRASPSPRSSAGSRPPTSCARRPRWSAAAEAAATTSPRPAGAIPRQPRRGARDCARRDRVAVSPGSAPARCASSPSITDSRAAAARSRTRRRPSCARSSVIEPPDPRPLRGSRPSTRPISSSWASRWVVGGEAGAQAAAARKFRDEVADAGEYRSRPTTSGSRRLMAARSARAGAGAAEDSLAAAHLLESYLASRSRAEPDDPNGAPE